MSNNISEELLNDLTEEERQQVLSILKDFSTTGKSQSYEDLLYADYAEMPADIETFLKDERYLGKGLVNSEGKFTVYPYWVKVLHKIFPNPLDTSINTLVLTGGIGLGKSFCAVLIILYYLHRVMCLKDANLHFGLQPMDEIWFSMMNITLEAAQGVAWSKLQELLQTSPWFLDRGIIRGKENLEWQPKNKKIRLVYGSNNNRLLGKAVLINFSDEVNFAAMTTDVEKIKKKYMRLISQVDARLQSRFMKGTKKPYINIIASSKDSEQAFMESYINMKKKNESKTTMIVDEPQWVIRTDKDSKEKFWVAVGNKFQASEVLPKNASAELVSEFRDKGFSMLPVPIGYYENFKDNVELALTDIAGISTVGALKYISGVRFKQIKTTEYENPFSRETFETGTKDELEYSEFFDISKISKEDFVKPLFIHLDLSKTGDRTGVAGTFIRGRRENVEASKELMFKVAFSAGIQAPKGDELSFEKMRNFIRWLRDQGLNIKGISADTALSAQILQQLRSDFDTAEYKVVSVLSVDKLESVDGTKQKICKPYQFFRSTIYEKRIQIYDRCDLLTDEIIGLEREPDGHINHPKDGTQGSKDIADAVCGSMYNASLHAEEFEFYNDYTMEDIVELNDELDRGGIYERDTFAKAFENELKNMKLGPRVGIVKNAEGNAVRQDDEWLDAIL